MEYWTAADIPDQTGRTFIVTGANAGLGYATTDALVAKGAHVILACRNTAKAEAAQRTIHSASASGTSEVVELDLGDLDQVREFASGLGDRPVDVLVNNAGIMAVPLGRTAQGHELQFGTNVLGHFLLTALVMPHVPDRVVWVSSSAHRFGEIALDDLDWHERSYNPWRAYGQSKLADLMLAYELQRRLTSATSPKRSMAAHPGYASTNLQNHTGTWQDRLMQRMNRASWIAQPAEMGALPTLFAATVPDLAGGSYIGPGARSETRGHPRPVGSSARSHERERAAALWTRCEELTGQEFSV